MKLQGSIALLKDAIAFYQTHCKILLSIQLIPTALLAIGIYILDLHTDVNGMLSLASVSPTEIGLFVLLMVTAFVLYIVASISLIFFIANPSRYTTLARAFTEAKKFFFPYLWVNILVTLAIGGGFILLIVPGIIISIWLLFSNLSFLLEQRRGIDALKASKALVKGRWFAVFGRLLAVMLPYIIATIFSSIILELLISNSALSTALSNFFGSLIFGPILAIYLYFLYKNLKSVEIPTPLIEIPKPQ